MKKYVLALDQGTTSSRTIVFDKKGEIVSKAQYEFEQIYPNSGWVEHNPYEILDSQLRSLSAALMNGRIDAEEIAAIGITNQRETTILWNKDTGKPVYNAIVWQCRRTAPICEKLKADGLEPYVKEHTGLLIDAYFSATKIKWILDNVSGAREAANRGELLFGTIDTWLMWKLSNGKIHATDQTNASRTMLYDIHNLCWDKKLLEILDIPERVETKSVLFDSMLNYVQFNFMNEITIRDIAQACACSQSTVCHVFKQYTGKSIKKYIPAQRITRERRAPIIFLLRWAANFLRRFFRAISNSFCSFFANSLPPYLFLSEYFISAVQTAPQTTAETIASVIPAPVMVAETVAIRVLYAISFAAE